ncbi:MAG: tRNA dihydrouridine(16) synthase DusC [Gammaproteobacteria bacterium]|nr:tRNA dihydrouridine(16) synthase DusC [Gammaproteobacteria bacterium]
MKLILAPMEGLLDTYLREIITNTGGYDWCVSEFIRVTTMVLPDKVFYRSVPELLNGGVTRSGTPVYIQLMGNNPSVVSDNAAKAVELGALGLDLNFGCPSPTVNGKGAGAILLNEPEKVHQIVAAARQAVPSTTPFMAKVRLGYDHTDNIIEIAQGIEAAGADMITVHARTSADKYIAPARWEWLARIRESIKIPVIANGDITDINSFQQCRSISGCDHFMIGRASVRHPFLALQIQQSIRNQSIQHISWPQQQELLLQFAILMRKSKNDIGSASRVKKWLKILSKGSKTTQQGADKMFDQIKEMKTLDQISQVLTAV